MRQSEAAAQDQAPLVDHRVELHAARGEETRGLRGAFASADLLVVAEREQDRALRTEAFREQRLRRLEQRDDRDLVIERAAAPDESIADRAAERRLFPLPLRRRLPPHHV